MELETGKTLFTLLLPKPFPHIEKLYCSRKKGLFVPSYNRRVGFHRPIWTPYMNTTNMDTTNV